ncbi:MAG: LptF/LptG family permease [Treponema sp.]|nr:LptF/LptG family permease [Treponema sp.]
MRFVYYILRKVIPFFIGALIFVALILNLVDLFMNISRYLELAVPAKSVLMVMIYYIPKTVWYAAPIAFLFAVTYVLSDLYAHNEMQALFASGVSLFEFVIPIVVLSIFLSVGLFFLEDKLVVPNLEKKQTLQSTLLEEKKDANNENVVVLSENSKIIYKAKRYRDDQKRLDTLFIIFRTEENSLDSIIYAKNALWNEETKNWKLEDAIQYLRKNESLEIIPISKDYTNRLNESYEIFRRSEVNIESVNVEEAKIYINHLKKAGLPYGEPLSVYYKKFAFPFIFLIATLLAVGLTGKTRKNVLLISLALSIVAVVLYYVFQMMTMVLAKTGVMPPLMGAWLPNFVFMIIAVVLLKFSRT